MKRMFTTGIAIVLFAVAMGFSGPAAAYPPIGCGPQQQGQIYYEDYFSWRGDGTRYLWQCWGTEWYLIDIQQCSEYGCISL
jgi:hypothetical protein